MTRFQLKQSMPCGQKYDETIYGFQDETSYETIYGFQDETPHETIYGFQDETPYETIYLL